MALRNIPHVAQMSASDCGYACLVMAIRWHGGHVSLRQLRTDAGEPRGGIRTNELVALASRHGLRSTALHFGPGAWSEIPRGSILHLDGRHFVVLDRAHEGGFDVVDPAVGRRWLSSAELERSFEGVVVATQPTPELTVAVPEVGRFVRYRKALQKYSPQLALAMALSLGLVGFSVALPLVTSLVVDRVVPQSDAALLNLVAAGIVAILAAQLGVTWLRSRVLVRVRTELDRELTPSFMLHLLALPCAFFLARGTGDLVQRLRSNAQVREMLTSSAVATVLDGALATGYLIALFAMNPTMGVVALVIAGVFVALFAVVRRRRRELSTRYLHAISETSSFEVGVLDGIETLKAAGAEMTALRGWRSLFVKVLDAGRAQGKHDASVDAWSSTLRGATPLVLLLVGTHQILEGTLSLGTMLALCALAGGFLSRVGSLSSTATRWPLLASHIDRLSDVFDTKRERADGESLDSAAGAVTLHEVHFAYGPRETPILRGANLDIQPGSLVAIVGASGAGKSTLARLIAGLYPPSAGRVCVDGCDLTKIQLTSLRRQLGVVTQDAYLLGMSIRENIALAQPDMPMERIVSAAKLAEVHEDVMRLPLGYDTQLSAGARGLSGGQRQRIAIARAVAHQPAILVFDEASSALDPAIERRIHARLAKLSCTRILISHRLSTVQDADQIAVLADGRIVEAGTHDELLACVGEYARLLGVLPPAPRSYDVRSTDVEHDSRLSLAQP